MNIDSNVPKRINDGLFMKFHSRFCWNSAPVDFNEWYNMKQFPIEAARDSTNKYWDDMDTERQRIP